jgi:hypothetical protein
MFEQDMLVTMECLSQIPQATKIWKPVVQDVFNDPTLFSISRNEMSNLWIKLFAAMLSSDKDRISELLGE